MKRYKITVGFLLTLFMLMANWSQVAMAARQWQEEQTFVYTVQPGDTLSLIALEQNLSMADIIVANQIS